MWMLMAGLLGSGVAHAAEPGIPYTARVTDGLGQPFNGDHDVVIELFDSPGVGAAPLYDESILGTPISDGYLSVALSDGAALPIRVRLSPENSPFSAFA